MLNYQKMEAKHLKKYLIGHLLDQTQATFMQISPLQHVTMVFSIWQLMDTCAKVQTMEGHGKN